MNTLSENPSSNESTDSITCPCCGANSSLWCTRNNFEIFRCSRCRTGFLENEKIPADLSFLYDREYYMQGEQQRAYLDYLSEKDNIIGTSKKLLKRINSYITGSHLIEVGCATGFFLQTARDLGWQTKGFEISSYATSMARKLFNLDVVCCDFLNKNELNIGNSDVVVALDVIEHLRDPAKFLEKCATILRKEGLLLISTGDFSSISAKIFGRRWRLIHPPEHIYYFTRVGLIQLLVNSGFEVLDTKYLWKNYSIRFVLTSLGFGSLGSLGNISIPFNGFDVMYIFARKR